MLTNETGILIESESKNCPTFIPNLLTDELLHRFQFPEFSENVQSENSIHLEPVLKPFFYRFICGIKSTNHYCDLSPNDIAVCVHSKVANDSPINKYIKAINKFDRVVNHLSRRKKHTIEYMIKYNTSLRPKHKKYGLRKRSVSAGKAGIDLYSFYYTPAPYVRSLLNDWLEFINHKQATTLKKTLIGHLQLILIHPFNDANGRTSRALCLAQLQKNCGFAYSCLLMLYMHTINRNGYFMAIKSYRENDITAINEYHNSMLIWANHSYNELNALSDKNDLSQFDYFLRCESRKFNH